MRKVLAFLLIVGLLLTASPAFAAPSPEPAKQGPVNPPCPAPPCPVTPTQCPVTPTTVLTGALTKVLVSPNCYNYYVTDNVLGYVRVDFGPYWYISATIAKFDYDGINGIQTIAQELNGLVNTNVTLVTRRCNDNSYEVFTINAMFYRSESVPPPWSGGPTKGKGK